MLNIKAGYNLNVLRQTRTKKRHSVRVSDCCLTPIQQFFSYIVTRTGFNNRQRDDDDVRFQLDQNA
jgi:hypothetical protein